MTIIVLSDLCNIALHDLDQDHDMTIIVLSDLFNIADTGAIVSFFEEKN